MLNLSRGDTVAQSLRCVNTEFAKSCEACYHGDMARSIDHHKEACRCPACRNRKLEATVTFAFRLPPDLLQWVREQGGGAWLRKLAQEARDQAPGPGAGSDPRPGR